MQSAEGSRQTADGSGSISEEANVITTFATASVFSAFCLLPSAYCLLPTAFCLSPAQSEVRLPGLGSGRIALDQLKEARAIVLKVLRCRVKPETQSKLAIAIDTVVVEEIR